MRYKVGNGLQPHRCPQKKLSSAIYFVYNFKNLKFRFDVPTSLLYINIFEHFKVDLPCLGSCENDHSL